MNVAEMIFIRYFSFEFILFILYHYVILSKKIRQHGIIIAGPNAACILRNVVLKLIVMNFILYFSFEFQNNLG